MKIYPYNKILLKLPFKFITTGQLLPWNFAVKAVIVEFPGDLVVRDSALSRLWLGFASWPGSFCMLQVQPKKKKKVKKTTYLCAYLFLSILQYFILI